VELDETVGAPAVSKVRPFRKLKSSSKNCGIPGSFSSGIWFFPGNDTSLERGIAAASLRLSSIGTIRSSRMCRIRVGIDIFDTRSRMSKLLTVSKCRAAFSADRLLRCIPTASHQRGDSPEAIKIGWRRRWPLESAGCEPSEQDKARDAVRIAHRIGNRNCAALRKPKQRKSVQARSVHDRLQVVYPRVER
jgi:hypothetical protein